jgi:peroxiredoxin
LAKAGVAMTNNRFGKAIEALVWIAAVAVLAENVVLFRENRRLREVAAPQIAAGARLQMLSALTLDGRVEPVNLPSGDSKLLIITFSPGCPACQANQEGWANLASLLKAKGVRVLWVSRDPIELTREYCLKHGIPLIDAVADPPYRTYAQLGLARVPNTILVGPDGTVEKVWAGRLDQAGWNSMFAYFGERNATTSAASNEIGGKPTGCGPGSTEVLGKSCK